MIPKVKACVNSLKNGVERTHILNGITKHVILIEIFTDKGIGTMITL
jgi:acetylglutamate kinase